MSPTSSTSPTRTTARWGCSPLDREQVRAFAWSVLWIAAGAVAVSRFFVSPFFPDYSALPLQDSGVPILRVFPFAPGLANLPSVVEGLSLFTIRNVGLPAALLFPLTIPGGVVGHAFAA